MKKSESVRQELDKPESKELDNQEFVNESESVRQELDKVKSDNQSLVNELDKVRQELKESDLIIQGLKADNQELVNELDKVRQELDKVKSDKPVGSESDENIPDTVLGWTAVFKDPYYKLYRRIDGKLHWLHIGRIWNTAKATEKIRSYMAEKIDMGTGQDTSKNQGHDDDLMTEFRKAYDSLTNGSRLVYIHRIRQALSWDKEQFDSLIAELSEKQMIQLTGGDPGSLTKDHLTDCYTDSQGTRFIALRWLPMSKQA